MSGRLLERCSLNSLTGVGAAQNGKLAKVWPAYRAGPHHHLLRYEDRTYLLPHWRAPRSTRATVEGGTLNCAYFRRSIG